MPHKVKIIETTAENCFMCPYCVKGQSALHCIFTYKLPRKIPKYILMGKKSFPPWCTLADVIKQADHQNDLTVLDLLATTMEAYNVSNDCPDEFLDKWWEERKKNLRRDQSPGKTYTSEIL